MTDTSWIPLLPFTQNDTVRLVAERHAKEPPLQPLADTDEEIGVLEELEQLSRPGGTDSLAPLPADVKRSELLTRADGFGWSYINAAFCFTRPNGSRFNNRNRGAWYASWGEDAAQTSKAELGWHLTRDLSDTLTYKNTVVYRELHADFLSLFQDLSGLAGDTCLGPDPDIAYPAGQALAGELRSNFANGVTYPSARREGGLCLAAFNTKLIRNVRHGRLWRFTWNGDPIPEITEEPER